MIDDTRVYMLQGIILKKRMDIVERVLIPVQAGEPSDQKHNEIMSLQEEAQAYAAELAEIIGWDETRKQWELLGRLAYGLNS